MYWQQRRREAMRQVLGYDELLMRYQQDKTKLEMVEQKITEIEQSINEKKKEVENHDVVNKLLNQMADSQRAAACKRLEDVCSYALQYATGRNLKMRIDMRQVRNKVAAEIVVVKPDTNVENFPMDGGGGGLADIISMALRFTMLSFYDNPKVDGPVIFDEPAKNVSADYIPQVADFLLRASHDFDRQIILSTHNDFIASIAPLRYRFALDDDDVTQVTKETGENANA